MITVVDDHTMLPANERIAHYGDGCFTTMAALDNKIELLDAHIARLKQACHALKIDFIDWQQLIITLNQCASGLTNNVVKVIISRGTGGRGYGTLNVSEPTCYVSVSPYPDYNQQHRVNGIRVGCSDVQLSSQPLLAGIKHANRLEQVLTKIEVQSSQFDDMLVCDMNRQIIETSVANVFFKKNSKWFTPSLKECGVEGVMRNFIIKCIRKKQEKLNISPINLNELKSFESAFICNSLMKIIPITEIYLDEDTSFTLNVDTELSDWIKHNQHEVIF